MTLVLSSSQLLLINMCKGETETGMFDFIQRCTHDRRMTSPFPKNALKSFKAFCPTISAKKRLKKYFQWSNKALEVQKYVFVAAKKMSMQEKPW